MHINIPPNVEVLVVVKLTPARRQQPPFHQADIGDKYAVMVRDGGEFGFGPTPRIAMNRARAKGPPA